MTRTEEYNALLQELEETPDRLNFAVARAKARARRQKLRKAVGAPLISLSAACFAFVLLVNFSTPFAMACAKVPIFKELAEAVCFNPSLQAAVENEWVQPIGQTDTDNGYTMTVEYLIVDQKQLNVFYTLEGGEDVDPEDAYMIYPEFMDGDRNGLTATTLAGDARINGELYYTTADFLTEDTMPGQIRMECKLLLRWDESASEDRLEAVANFEFDLAFDPQFTAQTKVVEINRWLKLNGQQILLKDVEIYPTHMRVNLEDHPDNTAWLRNLELYVENEKGVRFDSITNGISATGSPDSPFTRSFRLESSFFSGSDKLTLYITGAQWLEKEKQWTWVDLNTKETGYLPDEAVFYRADRDGDELAMIFLVPVPANYQGGRQPFSSWRAPDGTKGGFYEYGWSGAPKDGEYGTSRLCVYDYVWDTIELELSYNLTSKYAEPVSTDLF